MNECHTCVSMTIIIDIYFSKFSALLQSSYFSTLYNIPHMCYLLSRPFYSRYLSIVYKIPVLLYVQMNKKGFIYKWA